MSLLSTQVYAQTAEWSEGYCTMDGVATIQGIQCLLGNVMTIAIPAIGFIAFVILIVAGFRFLLSGGNSKGKETARNSVTYAVIGLVVALSAFIILNLISAFTGIDSITEFVIPEPGESVQN
jgi:hypothetical protein